MTMFLQDSNPFSSPTILSFFIKALVLSSVCTILVESAILGLERRENPNSRHVDVLNQSGRRFDIFWINRRTNPVSYHPNSENGEGYPYGATAGIASYVGHEFEIREMPSKKTGTCLFDKCRTSYFQVNDRQKQQVTISRDFTAKHEDDRTMAQDQANALLDTCRSKLSADNDYDKMDPLQIVDAMTECMEVEVNASIAKQQEEVAFQSQVRASMAQKLVPYACGDVNFTTSIEVVNRTWHFEDSPGDGYYTYDMQVFHERPSNRIFQVPHFVTSDECEALTYFVSPDTKYIRFDAVHDKTKQGLLVRRLANRISELTRAILGWTDLDLQLQHTMYGQELFDILFDEQGVSVLPPCQKEFLETLENDEVPSTCRLPGAKPSKVETRKFTVQDSSQVADVFLFCNDSTERPQLGGIHFPNAAVHINPQPHLMVMAIHRNLAVPDLEDYTTEYHFCPNYEILKHTFFQQDSNPTISKEGKTSSTRTKDATDEL